MAEMADPVQYEAAADELRGLAGVLSADVLNRDPRLGRPLIEVVVGPGYERAPPRVLRMIAEHDLGTRAQIPRPDGHFVVEVV